MRSLPQVTGPTENALRPLLNRQLSGSAIPSYLGWVCMNLAQSVASRTDLETQVQRETRCTPGEASTTVGDLIDRGLIGASGRPSSSGNNELDAVRLRVRVTTQLLVEGIPEEELSITTRVLDTVRRRAEELLDN
jgi:hypothetical protein